MNRNNIIDVSKIVSDKYGTADPFTIADKLNIDVRWESLGQSPLGQTLYDQEAPIVILNERIRNTPLRYFTLAHELGHVIMQEGLVGYYTLARNGHSTLENQANEFAVALLGQYYVEENLKLPDNYFDLVNSYGFPTL